MVRALLKVPDELQDVFYNECSFLVMLENTYHSRYRICFTSFEAGMDIINAEHWFKKNPVLIHKKMFPV